MPNKEKLDEHFYIELQREKDFDGTDDQFRVRGFLKDQVTNQCVFKAQAAKRSRT